MKHLIFILIFALAGCKSTPKPFVVNKPVPTPKPWKPVKVAATPVPQLNLAVSSATEIVAKPLTSIGENLDAHFSPDGLRIVYLSRARPAHKHTQIYELNLATMAEKRITYHNGNDANPSYLADGQHLLYASNTDEMKEEPAYVQGLLKTYAPKQKAAQIKRASAGPELPAQDLYLQRLDGTQIERLTRVSGFDGEPSYDQIHKHIVFTSTRQGFASLYLMNTEGKVLARLTSDGFYDSTPSFSPDGKALLWVRYASDLKTSQIIVAESDAQKRIVLVNQPALNVQPVWHPNGQEIVFSSNRAGQANYELYSIDRKGACLKRLTDSKSDESLASFSPDGKKLLLTSNQSGRFQIYMMDYVPPSSCLQDQP